MKMVLDQRHADIAGNSGGANAGLQVYAPNSTGAQLFLWVPLSSDPGYYMILTGAGWGGMALQDTGIGRQVVQNPWNIAADNMKWKLVSPGGGARSMYIQNKQTQGYLTVSGASAAVTSAITASSGWGLWTATSTGLHPRDNHAQSAAGT